MFRFLGIIIAIATSASAAGDSDSAPWALRPLELPAVPAHPDGGWAQSPIDAFILTKLRENGLEPAARADKRVLIRRVYFDLIGLPPTPEQVDAFLADEASDAFAKVVDQLLDSPRYGERWARHWMDAVHYAETHGHDEDGIRENAWPYRDYLIRAFNKDKPYARFVMEQVAGDVLFPDDPWATIATGFLACGPWDASSQMGIQDGTIDKKIAQYLDRDDMLTTTMSTFVSATAHCARCHDHKFDPISTEDYYALQAVFAGVDRVDRPRDENPELRLRRATLNEQQRLLNSGQIPPELEPDDEALAAWVTRYRASFDAWRPFALADAKSEGGATPELLPDGSVRFGGERPDKDTYTLTGTAGVKQITAISLEVLTDDALPKKGPGRQDNGNLHLSEVKIFAGEKRIEIERASADFNQGGWTIEHAIDGNPQTAWGIFPEVGKPHRAMFVLKRPVAEPITIVLEQLHGGSHLIGRPRISVTEAAEPRHPETSRPEIHEIALKTERTADEQLLLAVAYLSERVAEEIAQLPDPPLVFAVASHWQKKGNYSPANGPRAVHVLTRGDIHHPGELAKPGALSCIPGFALSDPDDEGARRAALATWLANSGNVLTWRSIANRVWLHHFGRGIVTTPNDFGAMGARPSHPELLDWIAHELRAHNGSLKWLHREICASAAYAQQSTAVELRFANRRRVDAESLRDAILQMSGKLDLTMGGPSARQFIASKGVHVTPNLDYLGFDPDDPANFRRGVYRFVFRTVPDPLMQALDCPDASKLTPKREESVTALQALAMMNNRFLVRQSEHLATRLEAESADLDSQIDRLFELAYSREPAAAELAAVASYAKEHGLANACRVILNSSEFVFVN